MVSCGYCIFFIKYCIFIFHVSHWILSKHLRMDLVYVVSLVVLAVIMKNSFQFFCLGNFLSVSSISKLRVFLCMCVFNITINLVDKI